MAEELLEGVVVVVVVEEEEEEEGWVLGERKNYYWSPNLAEQFEAEGVRLLAP